IINGALYGITPLTTADLENEISLLEFNLPGYQKAQSQITLGSGQRMPVSINLQPLPPVTSTPVPTTPVPTPTQAGLSPIMVIAGLIGACYLITKMD
ncbi:MAG: PEGA domain-containing protein, partial [Methanospirillum sp.]|uniref:PEGA domain-containing protein n=1 Tax=Methanospirillum sp. TaxID=45200 RepID=UPI00236DAB27